MNPRTVPLLLLLLLAATVAAAAIAPASRLLTTVPEIESNTLDHAWLWQRLFGLNLTVAEARCAATGQVLHPDSGECHTLYEQGPCSGREWLTLNSDRARRGDATGRCQPRPCAPGYGLSAGPRPRCTSLQDLCPADRVFQYGAFDGAGRCRCKGLLAAPTADPAAGCQVLLRRGACPQGSVLAARYGLGRSFEPECAPSPCAREGEVALESAEGEPPGPPRCYALGDLPCELVALPVFAGQVDVRALLCDPGNRIVVRVPTLPSGCVLTNSGTCAKVVVRSLEPFDWFAEEEARSARSAAPPSTTSLPGFLARFSTLLFV